MKFSLFFEMQLGNQGEAYEAALFHHCVEQAVLADQLGYHCVWAVEHHGLYEYAHSSAPEIFLSYVAAKTRRIRLGFGCALLPYRYNHPIRVAERVATLDILSGGRVNFGTARSGTRVEKEAFGLDPATLNDEWREGLEIIPRMWSERPFSHKGKFLNIPPTYIVPRPVQTPYPPMFAACSRPEQAPIVGQLGVGVLNLATYREDQLAACVRDYRQAIAGCVPIGPAVNNHFACNPATLVLKDDAKAWKYGLRGSTYFFDALAHYYGPERPIGKTGVKSDFLSEAHIQGVRKLRNSPKAQLSSIIGDPQSARETVRRFVDAGVDELILVMQTGPTPHEIIMESIRTFGEEVLPFFSDTPSGKNALRDEEMAAVGSSCRNGGAY
jgi:alkanesulfonate monooxygenase SsuD/methylene tetrahydromethanopterin reductase-like flavin-dependent oxidoreductase (luciferase family)